MEWIKVFLNLKNFIELAVILVEHPGGGEDKKEKAIVLIHKMMEANKISLPIPQEVLDFFISSSIDIFVGWMNMNFWKKDGA
uniref:Uncharacterized protein n=1 Tax=Mesoaciditoga lauensis TaxID=1495039 RepID=A0A7V3VSQ4_9BACT